MVLPSPALHKNACSKWGGIRVGGVIYLPCMPRSRIMISHNEIYNSTSWQGKLRKNYDICMGIGTVVDGLKCRLRTKSLSCCLRWGGCCCSNRAGASIPSNSFNHLPIVDDVTGLCGFLKEIRSGLGVLSSVLHNSAVLPSYSFIVA